ncbi:MAG: hypothetical protein GXN94_02710, partial [Aquificae bacterium]|nr:hypothetical protein [Aquificota bacterium]
MKEGKSPFVEVALPVSQFMTFTYYLPEHLQEKASVGSRVLVPFRHTKMTGVVVSFSADTDLKSVKAVEELPDSEPVFDETYIKIMEKLSHYYITPLGITVHYAMPEGLRWKYDRKRGIWIKPAGDDTVYLPVSSQTSGLSPKAKQLLEFLMEKGGATKSQIKEWGFSLNTLYSLIKKGLVVGKKVELPPAGKEGFTALPPEKTTFER